MLASRGYIATIIYIYTINLLNIATVKINYWFHHAVYVRVHVHFILCVGCVSAWPIVTHTYNIYIDIEIYGTYNCLHILMHVLLFTGLVDEDTANIVEGVADAAENQASADRDATLTDRLKMAGGDAAGMVADNVDDPYITVSCES